MISPQSSCIAPGAFGAFTVSEALLYHTKLPKCVEHYTLYQFQDRIRRQQNKRETDKGEKRDHDDVPDSPLSSLQGLSYKDPAFLDSAEVSLWINKVLYCSTFGVKVDSRQIVVSHFKHGRGGVGVEEGSSHVASCQGPFSASQGACG